MVRPIEIKSEAQRALFERIAGGDAAEGARRGIGVDVARAALEAHIGTRRLPARLGPERPHRHGRR